MEGLWTNLIKLFLQEKKVPLKEPSVALFNKHQKGKVFCFIEGPDLFIFEISCSQH